MALACYANPMPSPVHSTIACRLRQHGTLRACTQHPSRVDMRTLRACIACWRWYHGAHLARSQASCQVARYPLPIDEAPMKWRLADLAAGRDERGAMPKGDFAKERGTSIIHTSPKIVDPPYHTNSTALFQTKTVWVPSWAKIFQKNLTRPTLWATWPIPP